MGGWMVGLLPAAGADVWMVFLPSWIPRNTRPFLRGAGVHLLINLGIVLSGQPLVEKKILEGLEWPGSIPQLEPSDMNKEQRL